MGDYNPVLGRSYRELAVLSRDQHKSQAMVQMLSYGEQTTTLVMRGGAPATRDLMDGIDTSWNRLPGGARVGELLARAEHEFSDAAPEKTISTLLEARALVAEMAKNGQQWAIWKLDEIDHTIVLCAGMKVEAQANTYAYVPGAVVDVKLSAINRSPVPMTLAAVHLSGWGNADATVKESRSRRQQREHH